MSRCASGILPRFARCTPRKSWHRSFLWPQTAARASSSITNRKWSTPLAKTIAQAIETTGPISIAAYMRQCLTNPDGGYYAQKQEEKDQFGQKGDFITSPEISQIFGELIGIWTVAEWMTQGRPREGVGLIEVGPGRGTLMSDVLRAIANFRELRSSIKSVYLVESSPGLRETQKQLLCGDVALEEIDIGYRAVSKHSDIPVTWCEDIRLVPNGGHPNKALVKLKSGRTNLRVCPEPSLTPFIFAHEFFDALPIHAFQSVAAAHTDGPSSLDTPTGPIALTKATPQSRQPQWRELVVTATPDITTSTTTSNITTSATRSSPSGTKDLQVDFQLSLAKASTPSSLVLPNTSPRYQALVTSPGSVIEISPESQSYVADFARRIGKDALISSQSPATLPFPSPVRSKPSGAALIIDYGPAATIPTSTLRGIQSHRLVSPFSTPGQTDISADVDFTALANAACEASQGVEVHGPVEQGGWLERMGVGARVDQLCNALDGKSSELTDSASSSSRIDSGTERMRGKPSTRIREAVNRLLDRSTVGGMGRIYKVMAIVPERGGKKPVGFGGNV